MAAKKTGRPLTDDAPRTKGIQIYVTEEDHETLRKEAGAIVAAGGRESVANIAYKLVKQHITKKRKASMSLRVRKRKAGN